jgi:hypothetical protein
MPRPTYRLATETTRRRFASSRRCLVRSPSRMTHSRSRPKAGENRPPVDSGWRSRSAAKTPTSMRCARSTSSAAVSSAVRLILDR